MVYKLCTNLGSTCLLANKYRCDLCCCLRMLCYCFATIIHHLFLYLILLYIYNIIIFYFSIINITPRSTFVSLSYDIFFFLQISTLFSPILKPCFTDQFHKYLFIYIIIYSIFYHPVCNNQQSRDACGYYRQILWQKFIIINKYFI